MFQLKAISARTPGTEKVSWLPLTQLTAVLDVHHDELTTEYPMCSIN